MRGRTRAALVASSIGVVTLALAAWAGVAAAVSGGGYNPDQQDCPWNADNSAAPRGMTAPGCHNLAANVESGGQTGGNPNSTNARYAELGVNQLPLTSEPATPTVLGIGYPGQQNSQHAGCISVDTNGTGGKTGTGCGSGGGGVGLSTTYDYYNTIEPGYTYQDVPFIDPFSVIGGNPQLGTMPAPVPDPTSTKVNGGAPISPTADTNPGGATGSGSVINTFLTNGLIVYFGMDDNSDAGEHDGYSGAPGTSTDGAINGPSDGGAMLLSLEPQWLLSPSNPSATQPEGLANYSEGECADGICGEITTQQQTVYYGCGAANPQNNSASVPCTGGPQSADVYKNGAPASTKEQASCQSGDPNNAGTACFTNFDSSSNPNGPNGYRAQTPSQMNAEPGVQTYQDPDPQRSPVAPFATPGLYAGTCGVYVNDSGGYGSPGVTGLLTQGNFVANQGYVVGPTDPSC